jgi:hypothetical protein
MMIESVDNQLYILHVLSFDNFHKISKKQKDKMFILQSEVRFVNI